jgi:hypothetical protein
LTIAGVTIFSFLLAHFLKAIFERGYMPEYLKTPMILSIVISLIFACDYLLLESGLIAVTVMGLTLTNIHTSSLHEIRRFKETITILLVSGVFILLTADLDPLVLLELNWQGFIFILVLLFILRPIVIYLCSLKTHMTRNEMILTGFIAPRGVVCAAMAGIIGPQLTAAGYEDGAKILPIAFTVVILSVVLHSLMIRPMARRLNLTSDESNGVIIAGAYAWSIQLAEALKSRNIPVMLIDNDWHQLGQARLADIPVYYGELLSEETEFALEFNKYNTLIAATPNPAYNALICEKFGYEFGTERMFRISTHDNDLSSRRRFSETVQGKPIVSDEFNLGFIWQRFQDGWRFKVTRVGKPNDEKDLIIPEENEDLIQIGMIAKSGLITFKSPEHPSFKDLKEDDLIIVMEKEELTVK